MPIDREHLGYAGAMGVCGSLLAFGLTEGMEPYSRALAVGATGAISFFAMLKGMFYSERALPRGR